MVEEQQQQQRELGKYSTLEIEEKPRMSVRVRDFEHIQEVGLKRLFEWEIAAELRAGEI